MNIALIGYGKMGHIIEEVALQRGHHIAMRIGSGNAQEMTPENLTHANVAIEFTTPASALHNAQKCLTAGIPVVSGTTGWNEHLLQAGQTALENDTAFLHASNFSIGVNIFFEVNKLLATLMNDRPEYKVTIEEAHHTQKKDAPSGTAITIAEQIIERLNRKQNWHLDSAGNNEIAITAHRIENVPGTHKVLYSSEIDDIEIIHTAHNRNGFALGAVLAAEYIVSKRGIFTMQDVLGIRQLYKQ